MKELEGNPGKRPLSQNEPDPIPAMLQCPAYIKGAARKEWNSITPELYILGLLTKIDHAALEGYCLAYGQLIEVEHELDKMRRSYRDMLKMRKKNPSIKLPSNGMVSITSNGNAIMEPLLSVRKQSLEMMHKFLVEFGMTPAARTRVTGTPGKKTRDDMEELLKGHRDN